MTTADSNETDPNRDFRIGDKLRQARLSTGISLRELARRAGVSASFLSQVERNLASPSVGTLYSIVSELGISLDSVMQGGEESGIPEDEDISQRDPSAHFPENSAYRVDEPSGEVIHLPTSGQFPGLQRAKGRPEIFLSGVRWERLTPQDDPDVEFLRVTYQSGSESCPPDGLQTHGGKEYFHILSGRLDVQVAFTHQTLEAGDSINFDSSIPHRLSNPYDDDCIAVWFVVGRQ